MALVAIDPSSEVVAVRSRVFAMFDLVAEDPATGSAAASLGIALVARGILGDRGRAEVVQGVELARPSRLHVRVDAVDGEATAVHVAGRVHHVMSGEVRVPPT